MAYIKSIISWFLYYSEILSILISFVSLILAIYSIWYSRHFNKYTILITDEDLKNENGKPSLFLFDVFNNSPKAVTIIDIKLTQKDGNAIKILDDFDPEDYYNDSKSNSQLPLFIPDWEYQTPFSGKTIIPANESESFSYYLENPSNDIIITIKSKQRINYFFKQKRFTMRF